MGMVLYRRGLVLSTWVDTVRVYHTIPASGAGTEGTNYNESDYGYDSLKQQNRTVTPGGNITRLVHDVRGLVLSTWVGTNDNGATASDPTGGGASGNNMVMVSGTTYDGGLPRGDGNPTLQVACVDSSTNRVTLNIFDWRNRLIAIDGEIDFYQQMCLDNLSRTIRVDRRDTSASGNLIARSETKHDDRSRVFRSLKYAVNPATGIVGNVLTSDTWYDESGNPVKSQPSGSKLFTKSVIDGAGRTTKQFLGFDLTETGRCGTVEMPFDVCHWLCQCCLGRRSVALLEWYSVDATGFASASGNAMDWEAVARPVSHP